MSAFTVNNEIVESGILVAVVRCAADLGNPIIFDTPVVGVASAGAKSVITYFLPL